MHDRRAGALTYGQSSEEPRSLLRARHLLGVDQVWSYSPGAAGGLDPLEKRGERIPIHG